MGNIKRRIELTHEERKKLKSFVTKGKHPAMIIRRAQIILDLDCVGNLRMLTDAEIAERCGVSRQTVHVAKKNFLDTGIDGFLIRKKRETPPVPPKADGEFEAHLIALSCSDPPKGYERWSVRLLADKCVELGYVESISHMTVSRVLKKTNLSLT